MQRPIAISITAVLATVLVVGMIDTLVWLPEATAPGIALGRIYAALGASGDLVACVVPIVWCVFWGVLGATYALLFLHRGLAADRLRASSVLALGLLLLGATGFFHWWSAFAMGMSVSDELPPGYGTTTGLGIAIGLGGVIVGALGCGVGAIALLTRPKALRVTA